MADDSGTSRPARRRYWVELCLGGLGGHTCGYPERRQIGTRTSQRPNELIHGADGLRAYSKAVDILWFLSRKPVLPELLRQLQLSTSCWRA